VLFSFHFDTMCYGKGWSLCTNMHMLTNADMVAAAELQHEEDVKAAEGQHEKVKHAKASASKPEPETQGEAVATKVVKAEGHNPDSTPVPPQGPQVWLLLVFILICLSSLVAVLSKQDLIQTASRDSACLAKIEVMCLMNGLRSE